MPNLLTLDGNKKIFLLVIILIFSILPMFATNYYVSYSGDDSNSGLSPSDAWATVTKVNNTDFEPGDSVLFERGGIWRPATRGGGSTLGFTSSGTRDKYIIYGAYGNESEPKPRILGSILAIDWKPEGTSNVWVSSTSVDLNPNSQLDFGAQIFFVDDSRDTTSWGTYQRSGLGSLNQDLEWYYSNNTIYVYSEQDPGTRFDRVEVPQIYDVVRLNQHEYIGLDNLEIAYASSNGVYDTYPPRYLRGLRITNCHIHHIGYQGSGSAYCVSTVHSDAYIGHNDIHDGGRRNINMNLYISTPGTLMQNVVVENNWLHNGWHTTGVDMIVSTASSGQHVARDITIRNNLFTEPEGQLVSSSGQETSNPLYLTTDEVGGLRNIKIYNNIFKFPKGKCITVDGVDSIYIYYNTMYGINQDLEDAQNHITITDLHQLPANVDIRNNIIVNDNQNRQANPYQNCIFIKPLAAVDEIDYCDYNLYYGMGSNRLVNIYEGGVIDAKYYASNFEDWRDTYGFDVNSPDPSDPMFVNPTSDLSLQENSPAIGAAVYIPLVTEDYYGKPRDPINPTIGAIEYFKPNPELAEIVSFSISGQVGSSKIDTVLNTVNLVMPFGTNVSSLKPNIITNFGATIAPESGVSQNFSNPVDYTVTASNGINTENYTVTVSIAPPSAETDITDFLIPGQLGSSDINTSTHTVLVTMPFGTDLSGLTPTITLSNGATVNPASGLTTDYTTPVEYTVTAQNGTTQQVWEITVWAPSAETDITDFLIPGQLGSSNINTSTHIVLVTMPWGTDLSGLTPTITLSNGATVNPGSATAMDYTTPVEYTVTAQDGTTQQVWEITVWAPSTETAITGFTIPGQIGSSDINSANHTISLTVPYAISLFNLTPTIKLSDGATVDPLSGTPRNFSSPVTYTVTAEDGSTTQDWTVSVINAPSNETDILSFSISDQIGKSTINSNGHTVRVIVPYGTNLSNLKPTITLSPGALIDPTSGTNQNFSSPVTYTVTAEDGITTQDWVVTVSIASNETDILLFLISDQVGNSTINLSKHTVQVTMPYGSSLSGLIPTIILSNGATIFPKSGIPQDFSSPVSYTVTAQDGKTEQIWTVIVKNKLQINVTYDDIIQEHMLFGIGLDNQNKSLSSVNIEWELPDALEASSLYEENIKILPKYEGQYTLTLKVDNGVEIAEKDIDITVNKLNPHAQKLEIKSVTASSYLDDNFPFNTIDNNLNTKWQTKGDAENIIYELAESSYLSHVEIAFFDGDKNTTHFEIQASSDKQSWEQLYTDGISCGFSNEFEAFDLSGEITSNNTFKYLKIISRTNSETKSDVSSFAEFRVFGSDTIETGVNLLQQNLNLEVYPNPSTDFIQVRVNKLGHIKLLDLQGRVIFNLHDVEGSITINHNLVKGVYILQFIQGNNMITRKVVVK